MTEGKRNIIAGLLQKYDIQSAEDIQEALKDLLGGTIQEMLESEMNEHLGYEKYEHSSESNYRNDKKTKKIMGKYGEMDIEVPQERNSTFESRIVPKRKNIYQLLKIRLYVCKQRNNNKTDFRSN